MEPQPILPQQFYSDLNQLVDHYQKEHTEKELEQIYDLIQQRFQKVDLASEIQELKQLQVKLKEAHVEENNKVMKLLQEALNFPESKAEKGSQEVQSIDWEKMLPKEIWKEILTYLEDLSKVPQLSKGFQRLSQDPSIQALIVERYVSRLSAQQLITLSQSCGSYVTKLDLSHLQGLTDTQLASLIQACPNLQTLNLTRCYQITDQGLASLSQLKQLQTLHLEECIVITDERLASLAQLKQLRTLNLTECDQITDEGLASLGQLRNLQRLNLKGCRKITDEGLASLTQLPQLQILNLTGCHKITDKGLVSLTQLKQLQTLDLSNCDKITNQGLTLLLEQLKLLQIFKGGKQIDKLE